MEPEELTNAQLKMLLKRLNLPTFGKTKVDFITTLQFAAETPEEIEQIIEEILASDIPDSNTKQGRKIITQSKREIVKSSREDDSVENFIHEFHENPRTTRDSFFAPFESDFLKFQECDQKQPKRFAQNTYNKRRYYEFRIAAYYIARELSELANINKIAIFGSIARPLIKEPPHFKRTGALEWHYCKDLDLAVWFNAPINQELLHEIQEKRVAGLSRLATELKITFAHHQAEIFCFAGSNQYLGRLCLFKKCPKSGKQECRVLECGKPPLLQQHQDFRLYPQALNPDQTILIYKRYITPLP